MKRFILAFAVVMLVAYLPASPTVNISISSLGGGSLRVISYASGFPPIRPFGLALQSTTNFTNWTTIITNSTQFAGTIAATNIVQAANKEMFFRAEVF
jgi:hypothetical protein